MFSLDILTHRMSDMACSRQLSFRWPAIGKHKSTFGDKRAHRNELCWDLKRAELSIRLQMVKDASVTSTYRITFQRDT